MATNGDKWQPSVNQKRALAALLSEPSVKAAAKKAALGARTVYRYLDDLDFKAELRARQDQTITAATAALSGLAGAAIATLAEVLEDSEATHSVRVRAALGILQERRRATELDELSQRVEALEQAVEV